MGCRTNLPRAWVRMGLSAMGAGCTSSDMGGAGESNHISFFAFQVSDRLKKGFAFLVNLSLKHGWITILPLVPLGLCQVRWRSRRILQRDTLGKKKVLLCFQ